MCRAPEGGGPRADGDGQDRPAARSLLLRHQDRLAARPRGGRARARRRPGISPSAPSTRFLIWRLTGGRVHATDATNASRTLLYDIAKGDLGRRPAASCSTCRASMLPEVRDSNADFGTTEPSILGAALPILGVAGDQQAATIGQACFAPGMVKATYGTGCFALLNTGDRARRLQQPPAHHRRLSARRQAHLRAGGRDLHRRRGRAVAARRPQDHRLGARERGAWRPMPMPGRTSISCRPSSASARPTGSRRRAARCSA